MNDKDKHKLVGSLITFVTGGILFLITKNLYLSLLPGFLIGCLAGFVKEYLDKRKGGKFDWWDIGATIFGAGVGFIILRVLIDVLSQ